jgi:hypothetical protein
LDELIEIGFVDHLARGRRDVHADLERILVDMAQLSARKVGEHVP